MSEDIAVVGVALRFPGNATSPEELWDVLEQGESQWSEIPKDRLNIDGYYHPSGDRQGSISFRGGHFLKSDVGAFDAPFFSVAAEDAKAIDPQQRMLLEVSYEAVENAGLRKEDLDGSDTAVYVGSFVKDYEQICLRDPDWQPQYAATGNGIAIMANRISYFFNLHGPSMTLDTGCSGSLVSIHLAAQSLRTGESSLAIAAGAGMILTPNTIMPMTALNFLSPDGKCFTFDARANGYGRGEGIGVVVLKRLSDAIRDNDPIRAVIRGTGVNQDGRTTGITLPSKEAQVANIRAIYKAAKLDFDQTAYVECHGTGTQAGDWRELKAISETLASVRSTDRPVIVGSVKPNIGHLEGAAGVAGLIKGVLILEHGKIPPNINFENGNPDIDFRNWKVKVPREVLDWPLSGIRRVSVNCFGFGGTNAHVIMDEAPMRASRSTNGHMESVAHAYYLGKEWKTYNKQALPRLFCYSSHEKGGVKRIMDSHLPYLETKQIDNRTEFMQNYSYTLGCRRSNLEWKGTVVANSVAELIAKIRDVNSVNLFRSSKPRRPRIGLVFCGQGSQWAQMGKDLMSFAVFRRSLEEASYYLKTTFSSPFDLLEEIFKAPSDSRIDDPEISQPAVTVLQVALVDLFESFDVFPSHVVGHSSGEIAAAYASSGLSRHAAWEVAYFRGLAAASLPIVAPKLHGGMAVVGLSLKETEDYVASVGSSAQVACINSPRSITISGLAESIEKIADDLCSKKVFCRVLKVKTAYHSSHMRLVELDYKDSLRNVGCRDFASTVRMFSSVTGHAIKGSELDGSYWAKNLVSPVQYVAAIESMMGLPADERPEIIIEMSPRVTLRTPTLDILEDTVPTLQLPYLAVLDGKTHGIESVLGIAGELWCRGYSINMQNIVAQAKETSQSLSDLPPYAWNHDKSYWHESHLGRAHRFRQYPRQDLIGAPTADSVSFEPRWRGFLRISENPWIQDHQVQKTIVYPAAGMVSMVLEGARQTTSNSVGLLGYEIVDMRIEKAMVIPNTAHGLEVALNIKRNQSGSDKYDSPELEEFSIYSKGLDRPWERHATGSLRIRYKAGGHNASFRSYQARHADLKASCTDAHTPRQLYELLDSVGMNYGGLFQNITDIRTGGDSCVASVRVPDTKSKMPAKFEYRHLIHPATLDSMFQTLFAIEPVPMVPTFIRSLFVSAELGTQEGSYFTGYATARRTGLRDADATIVMQQSESSHSYVAINGLHLTGLAATPPEQGGFLPNHRNLCTEIAWNEDVAFAKPTEFHEQVTMLAHKYPDLSILQVGGGFSLARATLALVAPSLHDTPCLTRYTIADTDEVFSEIYAFAKGTSLEPFLEKKVVDTSDTLPTYDLIIVMDDSGVDLDHLRGHLKPEGLLLSKSLGPMSNIASDEGLAVAPNVAPDAAMFSRQLKYMNHGDDQETLLNTYQNQQVAEVGSFSGSIVVLERKWWYPEVEGFISHLERVVKESCPAASFSRVTPEDVLGSPQSVAGKMVISVLDFCVMSQNQFVYGWTETEFNVFHSLQKSAKGIIWITRAANMKPLNPRGAPIVALARTLISEDPLKSIVTFDIDHGTTFGDATNAGNVFAVFCRTFLTRSTSRPREMEYAEEDGKIYIPRLRPVTTLNNLIEQNDHNAGLVQKAFHQDAPAGSSGSLQLTITQPGLADDSLYFTEFSLPEIGPDEVEVTVDRAAITHLDLETIMGRTVESTVGMDVEGRVKRVGSNVTDLKASDHVVALVADGAIKNTVRVDSRFVKKNFGSTQASFAISAYYGIVHMGRVKAGHKVLVHAAMSPHGLMAVRLAIFRGAEVFATIFGAELDHQRQVLQSHGIFYDHILEADEDEFATVVQSMTNGKGVDVVYNPSQRNTEACFKCVRKCGSVVRFASKSPSPEAIRTPADSITIVNFDLRQLLQEDKDTVAKLLDRTWRFSAQGVFFGGISRDYEMHDTVNAFRDVDKKPHEGYVSLCTRADGSTRVPVLSQAVSKPLHEALDSNGTYLLAGGLGGLGRSISELLVSNGAQHLAFLSRTGAASEQARLFIEGLTQKGIDARVYCVDICDRRALSQVVEGQMAAEMPPVKGVFQCAGVIKDAVFENMTYAGWKAAFNPKTAGSWNLMRTIQTPDHYPFFVFLASSAGVIGNRGQANYAAGNCFEDALARYCRLQGRQAVSIDLGPVLGAGMLAEDEGILNILRASGFYGIRHEDFLKVVHHAITMEILPGTPMPPQVTLGVGTGGIILQNKPADPYWSRTALYSYLNLIDMPPPDLSSVSDSSGSQDLRTMLACCTDSATAAGIVAAGLAGMLAKAMNMLPEEIDVGKPPNAYGVDSLVAVGVRNWVFSTVGVQVSVFEVLSDSTVAELAVMIADKGGFGVEKA